MPWLASGYVPPFHAASAHLAMNDRVATYVTRMRPTDLCLPNQPIYLHPRSWFSSCLAPPGDEPDDVTDRGTRRFTTSLARFGRIDEA
jgi:hypothetical protein